MIIPSYPSCCHTTTLPPHHKNVIVSLSLLPPVNPSLPSVPDLSKKMSFLKRAFKYYYVPQELIDLSSVLYFLFPITEEIRRKKLFLFLSRYRSFQRYTDTYRRWPRRCVDQQLYSHIRFSCSQNLI